MNSIDDSSGSKGVCLYVQWCVCVCCFCFFWGGGGGGGVHRNMLHDVFSLLLKCPLRTIRTSESNADLQIMLLSMLSPMSPMPHSVTQQVCKEYAALYHELTEVWICIYFN